MKNSNVMRLWITIFLNRFFLGSLSLGAVAFLCLFSLGGKVWPLIIAGFVLALFLVFVAKEVIWGIRATKAYLLNAPFPSHVKFKIEWNLPPGFVGCPEGPTPCYAYLKSEGPEEKVEIHPLIFKTRIMECHDGTALVYSLSNRPYVIQTNVGVAWVTNWL